MCDFRVHAAIAAVGMCRASRSGSDHGTCLADGPRAHEPGLSMRAESPHDVAFDALVGSFVRPRSGMHMSSTATILVVLEDVGVDEESVRCALELAKRFAGRVEVLVLGASESADAVESDSHAALRQAALEEGVDLIVDQRSGDKASELLKYLAGHSHVRALVWGGDDAVLTATSTSRLRHWFGRIREQVECPIVTASRRRTPKVS
jgi:hypothetical protein